MMRRSDWWQTRLSRFLPGDPDKDMKESDHIHLFLQAAFFLSILAFIWGCIYILSGEPRAGALAYSYSALTWIDFLVYRFKKNYDLFRFNQLALILLLPFFLQLELGGFRSSGAVVLWSLISPMGALIFTPPRYAIRWFAAFFVLVLLASSYEAVSAGSNNLPDWVVTTFFLLNVNGVCIVVFALQFTFLKQRERLHEVERYSLNQELVLRQSEKLTTLGKLSAGMAHELNNPASAVLRGAKQMQSAFADLQSNLLQLQTESLSQPQRDVLAMLDKQCQERKQVEIDSLEHSDREAALEAWLDMPTAWQYTDALVELGYQSSDVASLLDPFSRAQRPLVLGWLKSAFTVYSVMDEIGQGAQQISHLVKALKSYTYVDHTPIQLLNIHEGLENTLVMLRSKLKRGVTVHREYTADPPRIQAYGSELNQVWTNIIDNAIDAMDGKGNLTIRTYPTDKWIVVEIEDSGTGIPPDVAGKIFDPFFTTKPFGVGTGLGLNISHSIITQKHHGQIKVESQPGKTCFQIKLPVTT